MAVPDGVSIVIPTYNRAPWLRRTLESLRALRVPPGYACELVVVDNNCTDNTAEVVEEFARGAPWPVRRIVESRQGASYARNRGLRDARFDHVAYFDDDVEVSPEWIEAFLDALMRLSADLVVGPVRPLFEAPPPRELSERVLDSLCSSYSRKGDRRLVLEGAAAQEVPGCNFGVRKAAAERIGGFDVLLDRAGRDLLGGGDFDFAERLAASGGRAVYEPRCEVRHIITASKLSRTHLRKLWSDLGKTLAMREARRGTRLLPSRRLRYGVALLVRALRVLGLYATGQKAGAFEQELQCRMGWAYLACHWRSRARA